MQYVIALVALASTALGSPRPDPVTAPVAQAVRASPALALTPEGCAPTYMNGAPFQIGIVNASTVASEMIKVN